MYKIVGAKTSKIGGGEEFLIFFFGCGRKLREKKSGKDGGKLREKTTNKQKQKQKQKQETKQNKTKNTTKTKRNETKQKHLY